ncbi:MAG: cupin domain-containing protein [Sporichthyaceae bacterium]
MNPENNDRQNDTGAMTRRKAMLTGGGLIVGSIVLAACGDDDEATAAAPVAKSADTPADGPKKNEYATADAAKAGPVPEALRALFNNPDEVKVQTLPCLLPGLGSKAVFFNAGARTMPHKHAQGQHIVITEGEGVFGDENGVKLVKAGDVIANPPTGWHWHGALPDTAMAHVTVEFPGLDLNVEQLDFEQVYKDLAKKKKS